MHALAVDDDDDAAILRLVEMTLTLEGFDVTTATDGAAAITVLDHLRPDVVVSDVMMPGLDGWGLLAWLRSQPAHAGLPVLLLTAWDLPDDVRRGQELGASGVLAKPFAVTELLERVTALASPP